MNVQELKKLIESCARRPHLVVIGRQAFLPEDVNKYCIYWDGSRWNVYYFEAGERFLERIFDNETAACEYLLKNIRKDTDVWG